MRSVLATYGFFLLLILLTAGKQGYGQLRSPEFEELELFGGIGTTHYFGDIGGSRGDMTGIFALYDNLGLDIENSRLALRFGVRYAVFNRLALTLHFSPMVYYGSDERSSKAARDYWFDCWILSLNSHLEYYFAKRLSGFSPYAYGGIGGLAYWLDARHFDGDLSRSTMDVTVGFGMRLPSRSRLTHSLELGFHYYLTDYLDGTPGSLKRNDTGFILMYQLNLAWMANFLYDHRGLIRK